MGTLLPHSIECFVVVCMLLTSFSFCPSRSLSPFHFSFDLLCSRHHLIPLHFSSVGLAWLLCDVCLSFRLRLFGMCEFFFRPFIEHGNFFRNHSFVRTICASTHRNRVKNMFICVCVCVCAAAAVVVKFIFLLPHLYRYIKYSSSHFCAILCLVILLRSYVRQLPNYTIQISMNDGACNAVFRMHTVSFLL